MSRLELLDDPTGAVTGRGRLLLDVVTAVTIDPPPPRRGGPTTRGGSMTSTIGSRSAGVVRLGPIARWLGASVLRMLPVG